MRPQVIRKVCICLLLTVFALTAVAEDKGMKPDSAGATVVDFKVALPNLSEGPYEALTHPLTELEETQLRKTLKFKTIALRVWGPPDLFLLKPGTQSEIVFSASGEALRKTVKGESMTSESGRVPLEEYAKLSILLERLIDSDRQSFGTIPQFSHPVVAQLTADSSFDDTREVFRNDMNFGDFRFWVFQSVMENVSTSIEWSIEPGAPTEQ